MNDDMAREELARRLHALDLPTIMVLGVDAYRREYPHHDIEKYLELAKMTWAAYGENMEAS